MPPHNWSYPPALLLFIWPLGFLPYMAALAAWSLAGLAAYLGASATHHRSAKFLLFVAAAPAIAVNLHSGQTGFFTAAILILFFRFLDERPILAGALLGVMLCKPHLVVLFPLALALSGRWRVFAAATVTVVVLIAATALAFGADIWSEYFRLVVPVQRGVLDTGTGFLSMMPTGFMHARMLGASNATAWMVQTPFTVLALAAVIWTFAKRRDPLLSAGVLLTASVVVSPYAFAYDMVVFGWLVAMLWPRLPAWGDRVLLLAVWTLPVTMLVLGDLMLPAAAPVLALFLIRLAVLARPQLPS
nr:glycosyltransferase family 87 protein [Rhizomicrobium electricum]